MASSFLALPAGLTLAPAVSTTSTQTPPPTPSPPPPLSDYVWTYISATVGPQFCWVLTITLLGAILIAYRRYPHLLSVERGSLSMSLLLLFANHLFNCVVFTVSNAVVNFGVNYNRQVLDATNWLDVWWSYWVTEYQITAPATVFFVTLDRMLALKLSFRYGLRIQRAVGTAALVSLVASYLFAMVDVLVAWPYHDCECACVGVLELWDNLGFSGLLVGSRFYCLAHVLGAKKALQWCNCCLSCVYFADCNAPGTEDNPIANRPCLPLLNLIINYGQMVLKLLLGVINIVMGVAFVKELMAAKIRNVVGITD